MGNSERAIARLGARSNRTMNHDAVIRVRLLTRAEGGRTIPVSGKHFGCPLIIDDEYFDCRLILMDMELQLGLSYDVPVVFLDAATVMPKLKIGKQLSLWEGKIIGHAKIMSVSAHN